MEKSQFDIDDISDSDDEFEHDIRKDFAEQQKYEQIYAQAAAIWDDFTSGKKKIDDNDDKKDQDNKKKINKRGNKSISKKEKGLDSAAHGNESDDDSQKDE